MRKKVADKDIRKFITITHWSSDNLEIWRLPSLVGHWSYTECSINTVNRLVWYSLCSQLY